MSRVEENEKVIDELLDFAETHPTMGFEQNVAWNLGAIVGLLGDISKSLAVIADKDARG